jgi:hypothetical protein
MAGAAASGGGGGGLVLPVVLVLAFLLGGSAEPLALVQLRHRRLRTALGSRLERPG